MLDTVHQQFKGYGTKPIKRLHPSKGRIIVADEEDYTLRETMRPVWQHFHYYGDKNLALITTARTSAW